MTEEQIKYMVERFLGWKLPENFNPDGGIKFEKTYQGLGGIALPNNPVGTNLLDYTQAKAMVEYMLEGLPTVEYHGIFHDVEGKTVLSGIVDSEGNPLILSGGKSVGHILHVQLD